LDVDSPKNSLEAFMVSKVRGDESIIGESSSCTPEFLVFELPNVVVQPRVFGRCSMVAKLLDVDTEAEHCSTGR
jgi:hypothetical protein